MVSSCTCHNFVVLNLSYYVKCRGLSGNHSSRFSTFSPAGFFSAHTSSMRIFRNLRRIPAHADHTGTLSEFRFDSHFAHSFGRPGTGPAILHFATRELSWRSA